MATMQVLNAIGGTETVEKPMSVENNALLTTIDAKLALLNGYVDQLEGYVDGLETAIAATNTKLDSVIASVDGLEGFTDGLETLIAATNTKIDTLNTAVASTTPNPVIMSLTPKAVAVSQTDYVLGATGAAGDTLSGFIIQPTGTTVGSVVVKDGSTVMYTYPGGTVGADLRPIEVALGAACTTSWKVTTPANATVLALGKFT
jgi:hypothetical protein